MLRHIVPAVGALALLTAVAGAAPATAQQASRGTGQVYYSLTSDAFLTLLRGLEFQDVKPSGNRQFILTTQTGFKLVASQTSCDLEGQPPGCLGISILALWDMNAQDRATMLTLVNTINSNYNYAKTVVLDDSVALQRYVITDGGVTEQHLRQEFNEFLGMAEVFQNAINEALRR